MWPDCARDPTGLALLRAAVTNPFEHTPRLVLADWLQEQDEPEVANIIRMEVNGVRRCPPLPESVLARWKPISPSTGGWFSINHPWHEMSRLRGLPIADWITSLRLENTGVRDGFVEELLVCKNLVNLNLNETGVTDAGVETLTALRYLASLGLRHTGVTDAGLKHLTTLKNLAELNVTGTEVTAAGVAQLAVLEHFTNLDMVGLRMRRSMTDAGLNELTALKHLTTLRVSGDEITDTGLLELAALKNLTSLYFSSSSVTDAGIAALQQALPKCKITTRS